MTHSFPTRRASDLAKLPDAALQLLDAVGRALGAELRQAGDALQPIRKHLDLLVDQVVAIARPVQRHARRSQRMHLERSEEHTSELQSLMRISYAVSCLKNRHCTRTQLPRSS